MLVSAFGLFGIPQIADSLRLEWLSSFPPTLYHRLFLPTGTFRFISTLIRSWITSASSSGADGNESLVELDK